MVSLIRATIRHGSGITIRAGFDFQDRGEIFTLEPGHANV